MSGQGVPVVTGEGRWAFVHVLAGDLVCRIRGCRYPIDRGVPRLLAADVQPQSAETAARFDTQFFRNRDLNALDPLATPQRFE